MLSVHSRLSRAVLARLADAQSMHRHPGPDQFPFEKIGSSADNDGEPISLCIPPGQDRHPVLRSFGRRRLCVFLGGLVSLFVFLVSSALPAASKSRLKIPTSPTRRRLPP